MTGTERMCNLELIAGRRLQDNDDYVVLHPDGNSLPESIASPVGEGGAGVVYRMRYKEIGDRAVKFLCPRVDQDVDLSRYTDTFNDEIALLAQITHTHIAKIIDTGQITTDSSDIPFFCMEYIDGTEFHLFWSEPDCTSIVFLSLCDQILAALEYLHNLQPAVMHSDVKGKNIKIVRQGNAFSAILLDLGAAKVLNPAHAGVDGGDDDDDFTYFFSSKSITRREFIDYLGRRIPRSIIRSMFPNHDLYSFGVLIDSALKNVRMQDELSSALETNGRLALESIRDRLIGTPLAAPHYRSVAELRRDWKKLLPGYLSPLGIDELSLAANVKEMVTTPLGRIPVTFRADSIIQHPCFQRLRSIPQLEFLYFLYPGAVHSRYHHSLNTFETAKQYISYLLNDSAFRLLVEPTQIEATLLWALLHDIGHYPLSHMFEDFGQEQRDRGDNLSADQMILDDEGLFWSFIRPGASPDPDISLHYSDIIDTALDRECSRESIGIDRRTPLRQLIGELFSDRTMEDLREIVNPKSNIGRVLHGIISSPLDVDKISYLSLDSAMTGVRYGSGMDIDALFGSLRMPSLSDVTSQDDSVVAIKEVGVSAAESVIIARYWMLNRVYWHRENRAVMAMIKFVISSLRRHQRLKFADYFTDTIFKSDTEALNLLLRLMEPLEQVTDSSGRRFANPIKLLTVANAPYQRLYTVTHSRLRTGEEQLYDRLAFRRSDELIDLTEHVTQAIESVLGKPRSLSNGDVLIDVPIKRREVTGKVLVYFRDRPDDGQSLFSSSPLLSGLPEAFDRYVKKCRVYIHPAIWEELGPAEARAINAVGDVLYNFAKG